MNKLKVISAISLGAVFVSTISFAKTGVINVDEAVVRNDASTSSAVVMGIKKDIEVEIIEEKDGFYKINYNDTNGYVRSDLLTIVEETVDTPETSEEKNTDETSPESAELTTTIDTNNATEEFPKEYDVTTSLNVYKLPVCTSTKVTTIEVGNKITINKQIGNWSYIVTDAIVGWIRNYNLTNSVSTVELTDEQEDTTTDTIDKGYVNVGSVNVRKEESTDAEILTTLTRNTEVEILKEVGNWYKVKFGDITGYIMQEYISDEKDETTSRSDDSREEVATATTTKYISVQLANVREKASATSKAISTLKQKEKVEVVGAEGDFSKIILNNGTTAYIASRLLVDSLDDIDEVPERSEVSNAGNSNTQVYSTTGSSSGTGIVDFAKQFLGYSYVYGGTTPSGGFDCSGFIYYVFNSCGYNISRSLTVQATTGTQVDKANLQLGDVIFFNNTSNGALGHVGIYIGDGRFIHAANPSRGVVTDTINSGYYYQYYYTARRIAN